jgi:CRP/FNR family transcriptional regulator
MNIEKILHQSDYFKGIQEDNLKSLAQIAIPKKIAKKERLFLEGQKGHSMFLLIYGTIQLFKSAPDGKEIVIKVLGPGEIFAEVILFEQENYPVSALALQDCLLIMLPKRQIHCLLNIEKFRNDFIAMLMKKQRHLTNRIFYLTLHDVEDRFFLFLKEQYGQREEFSINLSKKDIAAAIWTNPETLSRLILRMKNEKIINWEKEKLSLKKGFWDSWPQEKGES